MGVIMAALTAIGSLISSGISSVGSALGVGSAGSSLGSTLGTIGAVTSGVGTVASGIAANQAAKDQANQLEMQSKEEVAAAQQEARQKRTEANLALSRQQAVAAASGAGAGSDAPTIVRLMSDTAGQGEYNAGTAMYGGYQRAAGLKAQAAATRKSGRASLLGSVIGGFASTASGLSKVYG